MLDALQIAGIMPAEVSVFRAINKSGDGVYPAGMSKTSEALLHCRLDVRKRIPGVSGWPRKTSGNPSTLERRLTMSENVTQLPIVPCPSCGANILEPGFHNTCTESVRVREDNFTYTKYGRLYLDHIEGDETVDHESDFEAYCGSCNKLLPWPTYAIRCPDGLPLKEATTKAAQLVQSGNISGGNA
jgi:hypothetical protein